MRMARPNEADRGTDRALADLERRINSVYSQAAKELQEEIDAFFKHFADQDKKMQDLIGQKRNGKEWTEKDYQQWRLNQMGRGARLEALRDKLAERATEAKEVALAYVNDATPGIYSLNRNYTAYTIESVHPSADFTLFDEQTVKRLIVEQPDVMPYYPERLALKRGIDLAFGKQQITASVTGSILQGRSIKQISDDLQSRIVTMSRVSAIRAARTAVTAAQNAGRMDSYAAADEMWSIKSKKKWVATKDLRTRHDHGMADNQIVDYDQPFDVGGYKMMFPGDGSLGAPGHELYNCRCTVVNATDDDLEAERHMMRVKNPETGEYELIKKKSYKEWYDEKKAQYPPEKWAGMVKAGKNYQADQREYAECREILGKKAPKTFSEFQNMKYNQPEAWQKLQEELEKKRRNKR
nr:MAG TPA: minor capsid protein [Caudoviricetes sp.]